jgi:MFS transporter, putative metabolite:H+ symporter
MARSAAAAQTIEAYVAATMDEAPMGPIHWRVLALVASGLFFDVMDFTIFGALVPDLVGSHFVTQAQVPWIGSVTVAGLFVGTLGQGEFTDRFGRKAVYQFNLLLFGLATIIGALPPMPSIGFDPGYNWLLVFRFFAGVGLGAEQPLCFSYIAEYSPKNIRGRLTAFMQFIGGAWPWPLGVLLTLAFRDSIGWRGIWIIIGIGALVIFVLRFTLPESPRWLATHGQGQRALDLLQRMGLRSVPLNTLAADAASSARSDPFGVVLRQYPGRIIAGMACFYAFLQHRARAWRLVAEHPRRTRVHDRQIAELDLLDHPRLPMRQRLHDVFAGALRPQADRGRRVRPDRDIRAVVGQCRERGDGVGDRVRHDLFHPARGQFRADLHL